MEFTVIKFLLISILLYVVYKLTISNYSGSFIMKRIYLLSILPLSVLAVYMSELVTDIFNTIEYHSRIIIPKVISEPILVTDADNIFVRTIDLMALIWIVGVFVLGLVFVARFISLLRVIFSIKSWTKHQNNLVAYSNKDQAFSFWKWVHIPLKYSNDRNILLHEITHNKRFHSLDTILIELLKVAFWFNPLAYLISRELKLVHEFEVDSIVQEQVGSEAYIDSLLNVHFGTSSIQFIQLFNNKKMLKMRIKNLSKNTPEKSLGVNWIVAFAGVTVIMVSSAFISVEPTRNYVSGPPLENVEGEVDKKPEYKGGMDALITYMTAEIVYPETAKKNNVQGTVFVSFVVNEKGEVTNVELEKGVESSLDKEALRVVQQMPNWIPGEKDGKKISVEMTLPIAFKL